MHTHTHTHTRNTCTYVQVGVSAGRLEFRAGEEVDAPAAASGGFLVREDTSLHGTCVIYIDCAVCHGKCCRDGRHLRDPPCFLVIAHAPGCWCVRMWVVWRCSSRAVVLRGCSFTSSLSLSLSLSLFLFANTHACANTTTRPCMHARTCKCEFACTQVADAAAAPMAAAEVGASGGFMIREDTNLKGLPAAPGEMDIFAPSNTEEESTAAPKRRGLRVLDATDATAQPSETKEDGHQQDAAQDERRASSCADALDAGGASDKAPQDTPVPGAPPLPPDAPVFSLGTLLIPACVCVRAHRCRHDILRTLGHSLTLPL